jgi:SNF2 family DNA or RNA helicase
MVRVKKRDVLDTKDDIEIIDVELTKKQKEKYDEAREKLLIEFNDKSLKITNKLTMLLRLQQISEGLFNLDESLKGSGKLDFLKDEIKGHLEREEKVVVWSRFEPITREIQKLFPKETVVYSGEVSESLKQLAVWSFQGVTNEADEAEYRRLSAKLSGGEFLFQSPGQASLFCGTHSLKSGMGINLHRSSICYFTSFDWSPVAVFQARDRISRIGQENDTTARFLTSFDTIDRKALRLIISHYNKQIGILDGRADQDFTLTRDIIGLLK